MLGDMSRWSDGHDPSTPGRSRADEYRLLRLRGARDNGAMEGEPPKADPPKRKHR